MHYFSRITLTPEGTENYIRQMSKGAYSVHRMVWDLFPNDGDKKRDFLYDAQDGGRTIYCVSASPPVLDDVRWKVETKEYDPTIRKGDILRFRICANPVVANSSSGKHQKHDVVMNLKRKIRESGEQRPKEDIVFEAVSEWFRRKGESNGFSPLPQDLVIHSYRRNESYKAGVQKISFSSVVIEGLLEVTNADAFKNALFEGIGTSKAFGCGLLMVKRP